MNKSETGIKWPAQNQVMVIILSTFTWVLADFTICFESIYIWKANKMRRKPTSAVIIVLLLWLLVQQCIITPGKA